MAFHPGQRVGAGADGPADGLAVEQVDDGRQVHLAAVVGQAELGHVADPRLVGAPGGEVVGLGIVAAFAVMGAALHENHEAQPGPVYDGILYGSCYSNVH